MEKLRLSSGEERREAILNAPILPLLLRLSLPTILGMLVSVIYNMTDVFFVGLLKNSSMTASVGIVFSFVSFIQAAGFLFGYGSGNRMSKKLGEGEQKEAETLSSVGIVFALLTGILLCFLTLVFLRPLSVLLGGRASGETLQYTMRYLQILAFSIPFALYSITVYNQMRLIGNVRDGMTGLLAGMLTNMVLDPVLIFLFRAGFVGAAYATLAGQVLSALLLTVLSTKHGNIRSSLRRAVFTRENCYHVLIGGTPNFTRQGVSSIALLLLNQAASHYGDRLIASLTISSRVAALAYLVMIGWGQGFQPVCAMNYGAGKMDRVKEAYRRTLGIGSVFLLGSAILLCIFSDACVRLFSSDALVLRKAAFLLRLQCISLPALAYLAVNSMYMQNTGRYLYSLLISVSRQGLIYIPLLFLLSAVFGENGILWLQTVSDLLSVGFTRMLLRKKL